MRVQQLATRTGRVLRKPQLWFGLAWLVPTAVFYGIFSFGPIMRSFAMAVVRYNILEPSRSRFVGLGNVRVLAMDPIFFVGIRNTIAWAILTFMLMVPIALFISLILANVGKGRNLYQALAFIPVVVSLVAVSLLFRMLLAPDVGPVNRLLAAIGLPESGFLADSSTALPTAVGVGIWKSVGFYIIILTAGLLGIPQELYDAARVDGANEWQRFRLVTLPLLSSTLMLVAVFLTINALQEFTLPWVLVGGAHADGGGGPGNATLLYNMYLYEEAFRRARFGTATAGALMQFIVILGISVAQIRVLRPRWSY